MKQTEFKPELRETLFLGPETEVTNCESITGVSFNLSERATAAFLQQSMCLCLIQRVCIKDQILHNKSKSYLFDFTFSSLALCPHQVNK